MSGVSRPEVKAVYVFVEYADGVESYEVIDPLACSLEVAYPERYSYYGGHFTTPTQPDRLVFTVIPGWRSAPWLKLVRFEKKPGRSLMWALRKLLGACQ